MSSVYASLPGMPWSLCSLHFQATSSLYSRGYPHLHWDLNLLSFGEASLLPKDSHLQGSWLYCWHPRTPPSVTDLAQQAASGEGTLWFPGQSPITLLLQGQMLQCRWAGTGHWGRKLIQKRQRACFIQDTTVPLYNNLSWNLRVSKSDSFFKVFIGSVQ